MSFVVSAVLLVGCLGAGGQEELLVGDTGDFVARVEPILAASCANPACHGNDQRPMQVYAVHRHRMDPDAFWSDEPLTAQEHLANVQSAAGFGAPTWELCRKPLDPQAGGMSHLGGAYWNTTDDVNYQAILAWLEGR